MAEDNLIFISQLKIMQYDTIFTKLQTKQNIRIHYLAIHMWKQLKKKAHDNTQTGGQWLPMGGQGQQQRSTQVHR